MKLGPIPMILRTKYSLWDTTTKHHQCQRNSKSNSLMRKSCDCILEHWRCCADFLKKGATVNSEHYTETLKNLKTHITRRETEIEVLLQQDNARPHTSAAATDATVLLYLRSYHIQPTARILLLVISTCSPNWRNKSGQNPVPMKKYRLKKQVASGERKRLF